jgi:Beta-ketoacyl synthase, N-terminal domain
MCFSITVSQVLIGIRNKWPSVDIKVLDLFRHTTTKSQATLVSRCLQKSAPSPSLPKSIPLPSIPKTQPAVTPSSSVNSEIAVVGMAGRFPGASNPKELFQLFLDRRSGILTFPEATFRQMPFNGAIYVPRRGAITGVENFDSARWGIKGDEARFVQSI